VVMVKVDMTVPSNSVGCSPLLPRGKAPAQAHFPFSSITTTTLTTMRPSPRPLTTPAHLTHLTSPTSPHPC
jgi:hypothetical protein